MNKFESLLGITPPDLTQCTELTLESFMAKVRVYKMADVGIRLLDSKQQVYWISGATWVPEIKCLRLVGPRDNVSLRPSDFPRLGSGSEVLEAPLVDQYDHKIELLGWSAKSITLKSIA